MREDNVITEDFLLTNSTAITLYNEYARKMPIVDYHNHLPPNEIAENKQFENLTQIWLRGDHYKWRGMRALGVEEKYITGSVSDHDKFLAWAKVVPSTVRNPLFHWTHMELKNPFGINSYLNEQSADAIYSSCNEMLQQPEFSTQGLLTHFNVKMVGTTDDPCDDLQYHQLILKSDFSILVKPTFRPDKALMIDKPGFREYIKRLSIVNNIEINNVSTLIEALVNRINYFGQHNCSISDHGLSALPLQTELSLAEEQEFSSFLNNDSAIYSNPDAFAGCILTALCKIYHQKGWVQQFHLGAIRNNNLGMFNKLGADSGYDSIGDFQQANRLSAFLGNLSLTDQLSKTIIYNLNPADNELFAAMAGNFAEGGIKGKIQFGSGWWFLDQKEGIEKQLNALSNMGIVSNFIGMLTDSRSFLSYSRHDYFRRIMCNLFGAEMENGLLPDDQKWIGKIIGGICYRNAAEYFNLG